MTVWVVKLGGSLANSEELPRWLDVIATAGAGKVVLVPGGGPWADEVRAAQKREGFDDQLAHRKALRAMEHYGKVLAGGRANLIPAAGVREIQEALRDGKVAVWMPYEMVVADRSIPQSWDVTSDSLAAWLAERLHAPALLLVKSLKIDGPQPGIEDLMRRGWIDPAFAKFTSDRRLRIVLVGPGDQETVRRILACDITAKAE
jgi:aspartokinase-like uncharacterized kinase